MQKDAIFTPVVLLIIVTSMIPPVLLKLAFADKKAAGGCQCVMSWRGIWNILPIDFHWRDVYTMYKRWGGAKMQIQIKSWGNSQGIRFSKEFLESAGIKPNDFLTAEIKNGQIILSKSFQHRSLQQRAAVYGGELRLSDEISRDAPQGSEVW